MYKYICCILILSCTLQAITLDNKISKNKNILKKEQQFKKKTNKQIKYLANEITKEEKKYTNIDKKLFDILNLISLNNLKLKKSKIKKENLEKKSLSLKKVSVDTENDIVDSIIEKYSISLSKNLVNKESLDDIIKKEKYDIILDNSKDKILKSNLKYFKVQNNKKDNQVKIDNLILYINEQTEQKKRFDKLKNKQIKSLKKLKSKYTKYKDTLKQIIIKQNQVNNLLGHLNILKLKRKSKLKKLKDILRKNEKKRKIAKKKKENKKEKTIQISKTSRKKNNIAKNNIKIKSKKLLEDDIDLNVKKFGSSYKGIKTSRYKGKKTISPLKSYTITKKFGKYYDPIYKIKLFNESISLKSKIKNAKVYSVLRGKVIYAKHNASTLGSVVIVKHSKGLHTVYSQLSKIPKTLKVGKWIPKGYVVGRVANELVFQATKNNRFLNPIKLFK